MTIRLLTVVLYIGITGQTNASVSIHFDTEFAEGVLEDVCSDRIIDRDALLKSPEVENMVSHFAQFRDYFTPTAYVEARQRAAKCEKAERDIFRFNDVIDRRKALVAEVAEFKRGASPISQKISSLVGPYAPRGLNYSGRAILMIGTPSCGGWSKGSDFFVDLPCITGDPIGLQYLIAHESYHGIQDMFMPSPNEGDLVQKLLSEVIREGSATAIADFSEIEGGHYSKKSQETLNKNKRRMGDNFALLEMAISYLRSQPNDTSYAFVNNIGLSGQFDAPFYSVGAAIVSALEEHDGRQALVCLLSLAPSSVFARYHELNAVGPADAQFRSLGPDLASVITARVQRSDYETCLADWASLNRLPSRRFRTRSQG